MVLKTFESALLAAATRAMKARGIPFTVTDSVEPAPPPRRTRQVVVWSADQKLAAELVEQVRRRRHRVAQLPRQTLGGLRTQSQGGTWPDNDLPGGFGFFGPF